MSSLELNKVHAATSAAMKELEIEVNEKNKDVFYTMVVDKVADTKTITIRMEPWADNVTEPSIRASTLGNEERPRAIYKKIQQNLK